MFSGKWPWKRLAWLAFLVAAWYYFSYEYNVSLKSWLKRAETESLVRNTAAWISPVTFPLLLAIFVTTTAATIPWVLHASTNSPFLFSAWMHLWRTRLGEMMLLCAATVMGTASITVVYEYGSIQLVQVARSLGPLCTTVWAVLLLDQVTYGKPLLCLVVSLAGTMLASWKEPSLCLMTVLLMTSANTCMTFRNVITRRLLVSLGLGHVQKKSATQSSQQNRESKSAQAIEQELLAQYSTIEPQNMAKFLLATGNAAGVVAMMATLFIISVLSPQQQASRVISDLHPAAWRHLLILGGTNWAYNLASQLVLAQVPVVSHGMLELLKRVFVLVAVSMLSQSAHWKSHNIAGAVITFIAASAYFYFSHQAKHATQAGSKAHKSVSDTVSTFINPLVRQLTRSNEPRRASDNEKLPLLTRNTNSYNGASDKSPMAKHPSELNVSIIDYVTDKSSIARTDAAAVINITHSPLAQSHGYNNSYRRGTSASAGTTRTYSTIDMQGVVLQSPSLLRSPTVRRTTSSCGYADDNNSDNSPSSPRAAEYGRNITPQASPRVPQQQYTSKHTQLDTNSRNTSFTQIPGDESVDCICAPQTRASRVSTAHVSAIVIMLLSIPLLLPANAWISLTGTSWPHAASLAHVKSVATSIGNAADPVRAAVDQGIQVPALTPAVKISFEKTADGVIEAAVVDAQQPGSKPLSEDNNSSTDRRQVDDQAKPKEARSDSKEDAVVQGEAKPKASQPEEFERIDIAAANLPKDHGMVVLQPVPVQGSRSDNDGAVSQDADKTKPADKQQDNKDSNQQSSTGSDSNKAAAASDNQANTSQSGSTTDSNDSGDREGRTSNNSDDKQAAVSSDAAPAKQEDDSNIGQGLSGYYIGWLGHDNLGDEIVADIFFELLKQELERRVGPDGQVTFDTIKKTPSDWEYPECDVKSQKLSQCNFAVIGGGSTIDVYFINKAKAVLERKSPVLLFGCGYQRVYKHELQAPAMDLLKQGNIAGGLRGYHTEEFMKNWTDWSPPIIGDSGFLAGALYPGDKCDVCDQLPGPLEAGKPVPNYPPSAECIMEWEGITINTGRPSDNSNNKNDDNKQREGEGDNQQAARRTAKASRRHARALLADGNAPSSVASGKCSRPVVAITLRTELNSVDLNQDKKSLVSADALLKSPRHPVAVTMLAVEQLVNKFNFQVVLQAVDSVSMAAHDQYLDLFNERIKAGRPKIIRHDEHADWRKVMALYSRATASINLRLHSGVLAAGGLRPNVYLASLPKFADFMSSVGQEDLMMDPESPEMESMDTQALANVLLDKTLKAAKNAAEISGQLQRVRDWTMKSYRVAVIQFLEKISKDAPGKFKRSISQCKDILVRKGPYHADRLAVSIWCQQ